jgi:hypothetical protein
VARYIKGWAGPTAGLGVLEKERSHVFRYAMLCGWVCGSVSKFVAGFVVPCVSKDLVTSSRVNH